jgi:hypothetical protein
VLCVRACRPAGRAGEVMGASDLRAAAPVAAQLVSGRRLGLYLGADCPSPAASAHGCPCGQSTPPSGVGLGRPFQAFSGARVGSHGHGQGPPAQGGAGQCLPAEPRAAHRGHERGLYAPRSACRQSAPLQAIRARARYDVVLQNPCLEAQSDAVSRGGATPVALVVASFCLCFCLAKSWF